MLQKKQNQLLMLTSQFTSDNIRQLLASNVFKCLSHGLDVSGGGCRETGIE
jgi:hypothetical protein